ncbi:hypothetical protein ACFFKU_06800 [Kineococcus gynurae]|uniref:Minor tail protein n=1 Tax=Kineococcus gynurae TaxID=452979 RepID=A0ABV5LX32_9ACTN
MNGFRKFFVGLDLNGSRITGLGDPSAPSDAVNLGYLGNSLASLSYKAPAVAAATQNIDIATPPATFDSIAVAANDRILLPRQTDATQNGVWIYRGQGVAMTRATDLDTATELQSAVVVVSRGTATDANGDLLYGDRAWLQRSDNITVGTTPLQWIPLPGRGLPYQAGNGLRLDGNTFSAVPSDGLLVGPGGVRVDPAYVVRKYASDLGALTAGTAVTVTHGLGTTDITAQLRLVSTGEFIDADIVVKDANSVTVTSLVPLPASAARFVAHG